jgi:hypothetical protein
MSLFDLPTDILDHLLQYSGGLRQKMLLDIAVVNRKQREKNYFFLAMLQSTAFLGEISTKYRSLISSRWISRDPHPKLGWASVFAHTHTDD